MAVSARDRHILRRAAPENAALTRQSRRVAVERQVVYLSSFNPQNINRI